MLSVVHWVIPKVCVIGSVSRAGTNTLNCYPVDLKCKQTNIRLFFDYIISPSSTVSMLRVLCSCSTNCRAGSEATNRVTGGSILI